MPSHILYPPIVDSYMPAFRADQPNSKCEIVFSLSKFNGFQDIQGGCAHISIIKQGTGENVVYSNSDSSSKIKDTNYKRLRKAGIILNAAIEKKIANIKQWLKLAVIEAEKVLGGGTGQLKLRYVYDLAVKQFPWIVTLISFEIFSGWVDEALEWMKQQLEQNKAISWYVSGDRA